ncbi:KH domain-containing protein [Methanobacterium congolense]|jgi:transcription antitermination factor NusA-like protein|uniref:Transcription elongation factor NusA-like protein n=1 Tax=Methanobacterium congolense TaxID=118062 RepID=A0A1D3L4P9_9EURY|nr:KH domain-containing protein [Methanobacterium congolense]SCG86611.1 Transcription elongation factor NusA-like protein [Methanobacterium congolense]
MVLPVCDVCLKSGMLCQGCENKLKKGEITQLDLDIAKILFRVGEGKIGFKRTIEIGDIVIIVTEKDQVGKLIGKSGKIVREISRTVGKKIRVVGENSDFKEVAKDILAPARISGINILYGTDGNEKFKIRVVREDSRKIPGRLDALNDVIKQLTGEETVLVIDRDDF